MIHVERLRSYTEAAHQILQEYYAAIAVVMRHEQTEMDELIADPRSAMWLATADTKPVGCVVFRNGIPNSDSGECKRLYVQPASRRTGIADLLMDRLEQFAAKSQRSWIYLDTNEEFQASVKLYRRRGYSACERYNNNSQANLFFRKALYTSDGRTFRDE